MDSHSQLTDAVVKTAEWMMARAIPLPSDLTANLDAIKTVAYYQRALWRAVRELHAGEIAKDEFVDEMIRLLEGQMRRAWNEGMRNVGLDEVRDRQPWMDDRIQEIILSEFDHVDGLANDVDAARTNGLPVDPFKARVDMWVNRYNDVVNTAMIECKPAQRFEWVLGPTEHCATCAGLAGIVATGDMWQASGYKPQNPPNANLECGGWNCQCMLEPTDKPLTETGIPQL